MKYSTYTLDLVLALQLASPTSWHHSYQLTTSAQTIKQEETKNPEKYQTPNKLYCIALAYLHTQKPGLTRGRFGILP